MSEPIVVTFEGVDNISGMANGINGVLGTLADVGVGALSVALGGVLVQGFDAATGAMGNFFSAALGAEQQQAQLGALIKSVNSSAIDSSAQAAAAQTTSITTTKLSGEALVKLQDEITHAHAKLDDMSAAYAKAKTHTEMSTLALSDQQKKLADLTAQLDAGSQMITRTGAAMTTMTGSGTFSIDVVNQLADKFKNLVGGSRDAALAIETIAIRSGAISQDQMPKFIQTVADLGVVMGDNSKAALVMAKAQEDPLGALGKLQKAGILFSEDLKEQIKLLVKHGDAAGATALIMDRVAEATSGAAAANAGTLAGKWEILKNNLIDAGKGVAEKVLPFISLLFDQYITPNIPKVEAFADAIGKQLGGALKYIADSFINFPKDAIGTISDLLYKLAGATNIDALNSLGDAIVGLPVLFGQLQAAIKPVVDFIIAQMPAVQALFTAAWGWIVAHQAEITGAFVAIGAVLVGAGIIAAIAGIAAAIATIVSPIGLVIAAAALLGAAWAGNWGGIRDVLTDVWNNKILPALTDLWTWLQVNLPKALQALSDYWNNTLLPAMRNVWSWMQNTLFPALGTLATWAGDTLTVALQKLSDYWTNTLHPAIIKVWAWMTGTLFPDLATLATTIGTTLTVALQKLSDFWTVTLHPAMLTVWKWMNDVLFPFWTSLANLASAILGKAIQDLAGWWKDPLLPAMTSVYDKLNKDVFPLFQKISDYLTTTFGPAFDKVAGFVNGLISGAFATLQSVMGTINANIQTMTGYINTLIALINSIPGIPGPPQSGGSGTGVSGSSVSNSTTNNYLSVTTSGAFDATAQFNMLRGRV